ncbi:MAG: glutamate--tRNA ligase [Clostridia bacterium]|nr:glutamate--tRNA ligase [Clostridia bacterium]
MDFSLLAELLFPHIDKTIEDYEKQYPERDLPEGAKVTRFAPSPTGFLHIGGLFAALISERTAHQSGGRFILRIEDTDKKREVENGVEKILEGLNSFGINIDEGFVSSDEQRGAYGPYKQSERAEIYQCFAKKLVRDGKAYPCFCTEDELTATRQHQEEEKLLPGYWGKFAKCRDLTYDEIKEKIDAGMPYVLRLKSCGSEDKRIAFKDGIRGKIEMNENIVDVVILKSDGIPTYHFAHVVDDHLMRTTNVIRGDEWIASVPIHLQMFYMLGIKPPKYAHISPIMKEDEGGKRKISKRKDPEAAVSYYDDEGYPADGVTEYLLNLANYTFEDFRRANKTAHWSEFKLEMNKMSNSGALFDLVKLNDVCKNTIASYPAEKVYELAAAWAKKHDEELCSLLTRDKAFSVAMFGFDRNPDKPRKDIGKWSEVRDAFSFMFDELFDRKYAPIENVSDEDKIKMLEDYIGMYDENADNGAWFETMKDLAEKEGYAREVKEYKKNPDSFPGHVGDVSNVIRVAVTGRTKSPDLCSIMKTLGKDKVTERIECYIKELKK